MYFEGAIYALFENFLQFRHSLAEAEKKTKTSEQSVKFGKIRLRYLLDVSLQHYCYSTCYVGTSSNGRLDDGLWTLKEGQRRRKSASIVFRFATEGNFSSFPKFHIGSGAHTVFYSRNIGGSPKKSGRGVKLSTHLQATTSFYPITRWFKYDRDKL
jgi:hypothetical protein